MPVADKDTLLSGEDYDAKDKQEQCRMVTGAALFACCCLFLAMLIFWALLRPDLAHECLGFDHCPDWPLPYEEGTWPAVYDTSAAPRQFPEGFMWGMGTAAYQIEGGYRKGGRGASIWDTFTGADTVGMPGANCSYCCQKAPCEVNEGMEAKGATGNVACNHLEQWKDDIQLMKSMNMRNYRFSISWSRVVPTGRVSDGVSEDGVKFYNGLIDGLLEAGITPVVTLYHWDLPQGLFDPPEKMAWWSQDAETGEPSGRITADFVDYADLCFKTFGDRVKVWTTFNEPWTALYVTFAKAPNLEVTQQNASFVAAHNMLMAHAEAVDLYRRKYKEAQGGIIGITNNCDWHEPGSSDPQDIAAAERLRINWLGWFSDPIFFGNGDYPAPMRKIFGSALPRFTDEQTRLISGSADFFGLNTYGTHWAFAGKNMSNPGWEGAYADTKHDGFSQAQSSWLHGAAWGIRKLLYYIDQRYHHIPIYITESGWSLEADSPEVGVRDHERLSYFFNYTTEIHKSITEDGVDVRGYFAWSLMDNFEWEMGYEERFGVVYVDFAFGDDPQGPVKGSRQPTAKGQKRFRKLSSCWLEAVWSSNSVVGLNDPLFQRCNESLEF